MDGCATSPKSEPTKSSNACRFAILQLQAKVIYAHSASVPNTRLRSESSRAYEADRVPEERLFVYLPSTRGSR